MRGVGEEMKKASLGYCGVYGPLKAEMEEKHSYGRRKKQFKWLWGDRWEGLTEQRVTRI